ncbi:MAG: 3'-5' exonuclease, partial [Endomicrobiia bacterium]
QENIPVESEQTLDIRSNKLIKEILSLLKFIINKEDNLSFCSFILGDIFLKKTSIEKEEIQNFIFSYNATNSFLPIYQEFKEKYSLLWEKYFSKILEINSSYPLYDIILKIFSTFDILKNFSNYHGFFMLLLEIVYKIKDKNGGSIEDFVSYFENPQEKEIENFYVKIRKSNSVKVTTIHKSKGLEYNIVILPLLKIDIEVGRQKELTSKFIIKEKNGFAEVVRVKSDFEIFNEAKNIYDEEFKDLLIDELNAVYVGFTRAKERLYFFVPKKEESDKNIIETLIFVNEEKTLVFGEEEIRSDVGYKDIQQENIKKIEINRYEDWIEKILDEESFPKKQSVVYREEIIKGDVLHKVLSYINNLFNKDIFLELNSAIEKSKNFYPYIYEWGKIRELLYNFISSERIRKFFFIKEAQIYCEKEIVFLGRTYIVDRLIVLEKEVYVIDYKLSFDVSSDILKEYTDQVRQYKKILEDIYKDKEVKGFLVSLDNFEVLEIQ